MNGANMASLTAAQKKLVDEGYPIAVHVAKAFVKRYKLEGRYDDYLSEAGLAACNAAVTYNPDLGLFVNYLSTCVWFKCLDWLRSDKTYQEFHHSKSLAALDRGNDEDALCYHDRPRVDEQEHFNLIPEALHILDSFDRQLVVLRFMKGMQFTEIADILGCCTKTVSERLRKAIDKMRPVFGVAV
jgi:RNA polymerase sigma factor (sigma-70 family)